MHTFWRMSLAASAPAQSIHSSPARSWNELLVQSQSDTIFLRSEWIAAWTKVNPVFKPFQIEVNGTNDLSAGASFYRADYSLLGLLGFRVLRQAGDCMSGAEYADWPCTAEKSLPGLAHLLETRDWDCIWLPNVANWTGATERITRICRAQGWIVRERPRTFAHMELPSSFESYWRSLGDNRHSQLKRQQAKFSDAEFVLCNEEQQLSEMLSALFELNAKRWSIKGMRGTFARKPREAAFYREFAPTALRNGWLWLCGLRVEGRWAAVQYGYKYNNCYLQMQEGFDPERPSGVGNALRLRSIEQLIDSGVRGYDFLGEMTEHKRRWGARVRWGSDLFVGRPTLKNKLLFGPKTIWPSGRYLRQLEAA